MNVELYKSKQSHFGAEKIVIFYDLYSDDLQINNPLSSHPDSISAFYYSFPALPEYLISQLDYIFVAAYVKSKYLKQYGNESSMYSLVQEIITLEEEGVEVDTNVGKYKLYLFRFRKICC